MQTVKIQNPDMAWHIAANILVPTDFNEGHKYPTIIALQGVVGAIKRAAAKVMS